MKNTIIKDALVLFVITLIAGFALGLVHEVTAEPIRQAQIAAAAETYREVFPEADSFSSTNELEALVSQAGSEAADWGLGNVSIDDAYTALDASGNVIGYIINATAPGGYGGNIGISLGIDTSGRLTGLGFLSIDETVGLGMNATKEDFRNQFVGMDGTSEISYTKNNDADEHKFNALSGATYTSTATQTAVNTALRFYNDYISG